MSPFTAEENAKAEREHFDKYDAIAKQIGINRLIALVPKAASKVKIQSALMQGDRHLNTIQLILWDNQHVPVMALARGFGIKAWALCETVCVLKHVARHYIAEDREIPPDPERSAELLKLDETLRRAKKILKTMDEQRKLTVDLCKALEARGAME
jgi:hypothetical protein